MVFGSPSACIRQTGAPRSAARARLPGSWRSAETSLKRSAPASRAAAATAALRVSIEIGSAKPSARSAAITGAVRAISSASGTGSAPGRVDSPPMSRMSAPASARARAAARAVGSVACSPPSEKLSGVTLRMPMIRGRSRARPQTAARGAVERGERLGRQVGGGDEARRRAAAVLGDPVEPQRAAGEGKGALRPRGAAFGDRTVARGHAGSARTSATRAGSSAKSEKRATWGRSSTGAWR